MKIIAKNKYYISADAVCPYYLRQTNKEICCEGMRKGVVAHQRFVRESAMRIFLAEQCCSLSGCKKCLHHKMLDEKHGDGCGKG